MLAIVVGFLVFFAVFLEALIILILKSEVEDLKVRLDNARTSIDYWHDRWERERK